MKNKTTITLMIALVFAVVQMIGQTETNVEALNQLAVEFSAQWEANAEKVRQYAEENNVLVRFEINGRTYEMVDVEDGIPRYYGTYNLGAAHTTRAAELWEGGSTGLDISGDGYDKVAVWDAGAILTTHQEFTDQGPSRVTKKDGNYPSHFHATHVGGTIAAAGINPNAKGMAYQVFLDSYQWTNDNSEMAAAAAAGLELSNHSYGFHVGWELNNNNQWQWYGNASIDPNEDYKFGFYDNDSRAMDQIAYNAPNYLIVHAAGNDRGQGPGDPSGPEDDGGDDGFDCIGPEEIAKNVLSVGAVKEVWNYEEPGDVIMASFSSWGPADDGRIKPDIVGKGLSVFSTMDGSNTDYGTIQGTSMSAPNITGSLVLLQQHYQNLNGGTPMRAATLKGLALHTTDEAGPDPGPDYMFGWGLMNAKRAAFQISDNQGQVSIDERILENGDTYIREVTVPDGTQELRVSICWTDPPGSPVSAQLNPRDPMLVNDLDLKVVNASRSTYYPYKLDPENPSAAATTDGKNYVDNIEIIVINNPAPGTYSIIVDHDGSLSGGEQAYTLIVTGIDEYTVLPECTVGMTTPEDGAVDILVNEWLEWEPAVFATSYDIYFGTDGEGTSTPTNVYNGENILTNGFSYYMAPNTTYYLQVVPQNNQGAATGCDVIWSFTTMEAVSSYPYLESMAGVNVPDFPFGWQAVENSVPKWQSTNMAGHTDNRSMTCFNPEISETDYDSWFISLPFAVENGKEYNVSCFYKSFFPGFSESMALYWGMGPFVNDLTNVVFEDNDFSDADWLEGEGLIVPEEDGFVFLGFHVASVQGYGVFLDDIEVEDWGTVGISPADDNRKALIYNYDGKVVVRADESWMGADVKVLNLMGQTIYQGKYRGKMEINVIDITSPGLYIVSLEDDDAAVTKKVMIR